MVVRQLSEDAHVWLGELPRRERPGVDALWALHPERFHRISIMGRERPVPRWSRAYGRDYAYSGRVDAAQPVPALLEPVLRWFREQVSPALNGLLVNWYDGAQGHYIGKHRDSVKGLLEGEPIVTLSLGESRCFRLRPYTRGGRGRAGGRVDIEVGHGVFVVIPWATNQRFTHEVPRRAADRGRRISVTLRAFEED